MLSATLHSRYMAASTTELASRVGGALGRNSTEWSTWTRHMQEQRWWPAGNTLLAGTQHAVRPNCAILPPVTDDNLRDTLARARALWEARVGVGFDLGQCSDPLRALHALSEANADIPLGHRPQRGNMAVVPLGCPAAPAWVAAKATPDAADALYNFNLSVTVESEEEWARFGGVEGVLGDAARAAWSGGDPGVVFLDTLRRRAPYDYAAVTARHGPLTTVVPCGEQAMHANESCSLGAVNLQADAHWKRVKNGASAGGAWELQEDALAESVTQALRCLGRTLDIMDYAGDSALRRTSLSLARVGLGVMGWADVVRNRVGTEFASPAAHATARKMGSVFAAAAGADEFNRHITTTCIQPTGGITLLTGNSGFGVEPMFSDATRTAARDHVNSAVLWQRYVHNAVSKTVNLPPNATPEDVWRVFRHARACGLGLVSVYRAGSRGGQPMSVEHNGVSPPKGSGVCSRGGCPE